MSEGDNFLLPPTYDPNFHDLKDVKKMKYINFGDTGMKVSALSLGTGGFSYFYGNYTWDECKQTVLAAIKSGINYIDSAPWYGHGESESILGKALDGIPRNTFYMATKVGRYEKDPKLMFDFSAEKTTSSVLESLKRLNLEYIDVIQVHDIEFATSLDVIINETLPVLQAYVKEGKAKFIGLTGYCVSLLQECVTKSTIKVDMILSYSRLTLIDRSLLKHLEFFEKNNVSVVNAATVAMGLLTSGGPQNWHPANKEQKDICKEAAEYCKENNVEIAKLALNFGFDQIKNGIVTQLVGVNNNKLLDINLNILYNGLTEKEKKILKHLNENIFTKLTESHWEGVEVEAFRSNKQFFK